MNCSVFSLSFIGWIQCYIIYHSLILSWRLLLCRLLLIICVLWVLNWPIINVVLWSILFNLLILLLWFAKHAHQILSECLWLNFFFETRCSQTYARYAFRSTCFHFIEIVWFSNTSLEFCCFLGDCIACTWGWLFQFIEDLSILHRLLHVWCLFRKHSRGIAQIFIHTFKHCGLSLLKGLIPVFWWFLFHKYNTIHFGLVLSSKPFHCWLVVIGDNWSVLHSVFLKYVEQIFVSAMGQRLELVVIPLFLEHLFYIDMLIATLSPHQWLGTVSADECT